MKYTIKHLRAEFGTHEVIPNDQQPLQWTVNRIVSGDKTVLRKLNQL